MIITIDGPSGSGKSSTAKKVAAQLSFTHLDTGAMYRAITLKALNSGIDSTDIINLQKIAEETDLEFKRDSDAQLLLMDGVDVSKEIRGSRVTASVSCYCTSPAVRNSLSNQQRAIALKGNTVCEGRDMGTVVFPEAELKIFMTASVEARAKRRMLDFSQIGETLTLQEIMSDIEERDRKDASRDLAPLKKADDAIELDTTELSFEDQVALIVEKAKSIL